mmetsp:Transcript_29399/g.53939  ORF Transcript_29399/g.53939 Transcript_29399/m.53939 type:complete len:222 (-) Transcript_29399:383-1048(-)
MRFERFLPALDASKSARARSDAAKSLPPPWPFAALRACDNKPRCRFNSSNSADSSRVIFFFEPLLLSTSAFRSLPSADSSNSLNAFLLSVTDGRECLLTSARESRFSFNCFSLADSSANMTNIQCLFFCMSCLRFLPPFSDASKSARAFVAEAIMASLPSSSLFSRFAALRANVNNSRCRFNSSRSSLSRGVIFFFEFTRLLSSFTRSLPSAETSNSLTAC